MTNSEWVNDPVLQGGGECGALMRALDWTRCPLGVPSSWTPQLRTTVGLALGSVQPMLIVWGPEQITLYNDGYAVMCGKRHPASLGQPFKDLWFDIWDSVEPILTRAYDGLGTQMDDIQFTMHRNGYPEETHFAFSYTPVRADDGTVLGMFCACTETTGQILAKRRHDRESDLLRQVFEQAPGSVAVLRGDSYVFEMANASYEKLVGRSDLIGKKVDDALPEVAEQGFIDLLDQVYRSGETYAGTNMPITLQSGRNGEAEERFIDFVYQPLRGANGSVDGIFVQSLDVTDRVQSDRQQEVLNQELAHRLKNQLAMVQAIVSQTMRSADNLADARKSITDRIQVLGRAHDMIQVGVGGRTSVTEIVDAVVNLHSDFRNQQFTINGPKIAFGSRQALSLSLILHELATNAFKHGALSVEDGQIDLHWSVETRDGLEHFVMEWTESNGPLVAEPSTLGSGSRLIKAGLAGAIRCRGESIYAPEGFRFRLSADLSSLRD
ncbi:PAS domain-containing protein [Tianweitania sp. BSSL-BM11]|uniref:histidine kinase n=1 Tax=Tianweitania aestuarii TaxID=2814886 RepID=A0ABS5RZS7_9HYPH|nr:PAS domain-containing protein [Tianweitania aestuarii]MBS9722545.1 PAS domain-containing protein [Tianweitania aestuarii]